MSTQDYQQDNHGGHAANHGLQGSVDFLQALRPGGPWVLVAINPDSGDIVAITARSTADVAGFLDRHNGYQNCYYSLNPTRAPMNKKPSKGDIAEIEYICADLDPKKDESPEAAKARYLPQLASFQPPPTAIVNSGNGIQALWRLRTVVPLCVPTQDDKGEEILDPKIADAEARGKTLLRRLGSATGTQNIDRILRLPGTINLPTETKRKAGRVRCETRLLTINGETAELTDFLKEEAGAKKKTERKPREKGELPQELRLMLFLTGEMPAGYASRSELLWTFIHNALRKGFDADDIIAATVNDIYAAGSIYQHVADKGGESYVRTQIEHAINASDFPKGAKQLIRLVDGQLDLQWRATEKALLATQCPVFVRGDSLVQPLWRFENTDDGRQVLSAAFMKYNIPRLSDVVAHHAAIFQKFDKKQEKWRNTDPPTKVIETLIEAHHWGFPHVAGIITTPTMRRDGSLIIDHGYDPTTQLWYKPSSDLQLGTIGETRAEAEAALADLKKLIEECNFVLDDDNGRSVARSVALAAMMTVVLRGAFTMAPMFFFHKPEPGTGGSYLVKIISTIALGREAPPLHVNDDKKEFAKELSAAAYEGKPILNINNLGFDLESPLLSQMISEGKIDIRIFGKNTETVSCDCRYMTVIANGNNVRVVGELVRRTLTGRLDAKVELPETKVYKGDPLADIRRDRSKYLRAVLTIARAYMNSGETTKAERINGLEEWSKFVQRPLVWLGEADPGKSQEDARRRDPERGAVRQQVKAMVDHFHDKSQFKASEVYGLASQFANNAYVYPALAEAFSRPDGKPMTAVSIGIQLKKAEDRIVRLPWKTKDGTKLVEFSIQVVKESDEHGNVYCVVPRPSEIGERAI